MRPVVGVVDWLDHKAPKFRSRLHANPCAETTMIEVWSAKASRSSRECPEVQLNRLFLKAALDTIGALPRGVVIALVPLGTGLEG